MTPADGVRLRVNATTLALVLALIGNGAALVWGAAKLSATVEGVTATTDKLDRTLNKVSDGVQNLDKRVTVIEDRFVRSPLSQANPLQVRP